MVTVVSLPMTLKRPGCRQGNQVLLCWHDATCLQFRLEVDLVQAGTWTEEGKLGGTDFGHLLP